MWGFKSHRISKAHIHKSTDKGGLGLPIFKHYYWAANSRALTFWKRGNLIDIEGQRSTPSWLQLEVPDVDVSLSTFLFSSTKLDKSLKKSFVLRNSFRILQQIKSGNQLTKNSIYTPICQNPLFKPGQMDTAFDIWKRKGIRSLADLYIDGHFASFAQLQDKYSIPNSHFFRYLQIRHYVKQTFENFESIPTTHPFYDNLRLAPDSKHLFSRFVNCFTTSVNTEHLPGLGFKFRGAT